MTRKSILWVKLKSRFFKEARDPWKWAKFLQEIHKFIYAIIFFKCLQPKYLEFSKWGCFQARCHNGKGDVIQFLLFLLFFSIWESSFCFHTPWAVSRSSELKWEERGAKDKKGAKGKRTGTDIIWYWLPLGLPIQRHYPFYRSFLMGFSEHFHCWGLSLAVALAKALHPMVECPLFKKLYKNDFIWGSPHSSWTKAYFFFLENGSSLAWKCIPKAILSLLWVSVLSHRPRFLAS